MSILTLQGNWIYILMTTDNNNRCKIGSSRVPSKRHINLRTGDPYLLISVAYYIPDCIGKISKIETAIHDYFESHRIENHDGNNSEWFKVSFDVAEMHIDSILEEICNQQLWVGSVKADKLCKLYGDSVIELFKPDRYEDPFLQLLKNARNNN